MKKLAMNPPSSTTSEALEGPFGIVDQDVSRSPMVDLRGTDGSRFALVYSELLTVTLESPDLLAIEFKRHNVEVRGRNLTPIYRGLVSQQLKFLQEADVDVAPEAETFIDSLTIRQRLE
jgi:hypothetical protein